MPDVGVLNLQIHDDSEKAAQGLENLVGVLNRVKDACNFGRNLGTVAKNLNAIGKVINDSIQGSTIAKLNEMADALAKMQNIGKVNIRISYGKEDEFAAVARAFEQTKADSHGIISNIREAAGQTGAVTSGFAEVGDRIAEDITRVEKLNETIRNVSKSAQKFDYSKFDPANLPMGALGATLREAETKWAQYKDKVQDTDRFVQQIGTSMNAIIPYTEKNENSWESISERIREAARAAKEEYKKACEEALKVAQKLNSEIANKVRAFPKRTIEDYYHGMRFERNDDGTDSKIKVKDILSEQLRGIGTPNEQLYAFKTVAKELGMTVEEVKAKVEALRAAEAGVGEQATQGIDAMNKSLSLNERLTEKARNAFARIKEEAAGLKGGFSKLFPTITSLVKGFGRIAKYRVLRAILKQISAGISEGVQNVYFYSKAVGTYLAPAMDSAASALLQMKNSIGAAVAPVIESLVPVLQTVVDWFITAVNYANQFFALIRGQKTWTRAVPATTKAFDDQTKAAKSAGAAIKDLLADWDELNIIQSESGGGGSIAGAEAATDYLSMFEEVSTFSNDVKQIVDFVKDNFEDIKRIAGVIGSIILGWKISKAFGESLGALSSLVIPTVLTVDATLRTLALLGDADTSAISEKAIKDNIISSLEMGLVAKYLMTQAGLDTKTSLTGAAAAVLITFGALTGLKADVRAVQNEEIDADYIKSKALEALSLGAGVALIAKALVPGISGAEALGFGASVAAAATLITTSAVIGITATAKAAESGITAQTVFDDLLSSFTAGIGSAILIKTITGTSWEASAAGGAGTALVTLSALIGIQATIDSVRNEAITWETIIADATSSLLAGGGIAIIGGTLCGLGAGAAVTVGGLAALATFGALIGIQATLQAVKGKEKIKWGDQILTEQEVQDYVNTQVFDVKLPVAINLVKAKIEDTKTTEKELEDKVGEVLPVINTLLLGFDIAGTITELDKEIFGDDGLIKKYNATIKDKKAEIEAALVLVPIKDKDGNDMSADYLAGIDEGWGNISSIMETLGERLSDTMKDSYTGKLKTNLTAMEQETIAGLTKTMLEIATIMSSSQAEIKMRKEFAAGLGGLSGQSISDIITYYQEQKEASVQTMKDAYQVYLDDLSAQKLTNEKLLEKAMENGGEYAGKSVDYYKSEIARIQELYDGVISMQESSVKAAIKFYTNGEGLMQVREAIREALLGQSINWKVRNAGTTNNLFSTIIEDIFRNSDIEDPANREHLKKLLQMYLQSIIESSVEDAGTLINALQLGIAGYEDIFDENAINKIIDEFAKNYTNDEQEQERLGKIKTLIMSIIIKPDVVIADENEVRDKLREAIDEAMGDGVIDTDEALTLMIDFGANNFNDLMEELGYQVSDALGGDGEYEIETDYNGPSSYPTAQTTYTPSNITPTGAGEVTDINVTLNESDISGGVREGTSDLSRGISDLGQMIATWLPRIYNKDTTVKFTPSTAAGAWSRISATYYSDTTGMEP